MKASQQGFSSIVQDAHTGKLRLPEFQRNWVWRRSDVLRLFDSIRKNYPIGGFLVLEASDKVNLSPRPFEGLDELSNDKVDSYVLDGQQRITAGLALYHGIGKSHYFLNLGSLWDLTQHDELDFDDQKRLREFANDLDEGDGYLVGRKRSANPDALLDSHQLLWTKALASDFEFDVAKERYLNKRPERRKFMERLVARFKVVGADPIVPVTILDADMPVEAITRVFETLNTSGQRLTPIEIVTAVLFAQGISLREEIEEIREATNCYGAMDSTGEILLQAIALIDGKSPKKTTLPKTITRVNYTKHKNDATVHLDRAGDFLSDHLGMGLTSTNSLVPYDSMFAPLGIALAEIERRFPGPSADKANWLKELEKWFVGSVLMQRYTHLQPATQQADTRELIGWIAGDKPTPGWLTDVRVLSLDGLTPSRAIGKLTTCLISKRLPKDPLNDEPVGGNGEAVLVAQSHHIFPKAFCQQYLVGWQRNSTKHNLALNVMPLTKETNRRWSKMNPSDQINDVRNRHDGAWEETVKAYEPFFINERCLDIMRRADKGVQDYEEFITERGKAVREYISATWGFELDEQQAEDEDDA